MELSRRASSISLSVTLALDARAKALAAEGRDVVNMSVGEPDFDAPAAAQDAACEAVRGGNVRYTPAAGTAVTTASVGSLDDEESREPTDAGSLDDEESIERLLAEGADEAASPS